MRSLGRTMVLPLRVLTVKVDVKCSSGHGLCGLRMVRPLEDGVVPPGLRPPMSWKEGTFSSIEAISEFLSGVRVRVSLQEELSKTPFFDENWRHAPAASCSLNLKAASPRPRRGLSGSTSGSTNFTLCLDPAEDDVEVVWLRPRPRIPTGSEVCRDKTTSLEVTSDVAQSVCSALACATLECSTDCSTECSAEPIVVSTLREEAWSDEKILLMVACAELKC